MVSQLVPFPDSKSRVADLVHEAVKVAFPDAADQPIEVERPKNPEHGDFTTNIALQLAKRFGKKPREAAEAIARALPAASEIARTSIAGPGFINFTLTGDTRFAAVKAIRAAGGRCGRHESANGRQTMLESVSADPSGPQHGSPGLLPAPPNPTAL